MWGSRERSVKSPVSWKYAQEEGKLECTGFFSTVAREDKALACNSKGVLAERADSFSKRLKRVSQLFL